MDNSSEKILFLLCHLLSCTFFCVSLNFDNFMYSQHTVQFSWHTVVVLSQCLCKFHITCYILQDWKDYALLAVRADVYGAGKASVNPGIRPTVLPVLIQGSGQLCCQLIHVALHLPSQLNSYDGAVIDKPRVLIHVVLIRGPVVIACDQ
jgi:hypothetical protein